MKLRQVLIIAVLLLGWVNSSNAKGYKPAKVYMFGFAASFNDSTVYMTNIQKVDAYLANDRTKFLANREDYSYQLRYYLQNNGLVSYPTCVTMYAENENKALPISSRRLSSTNSLSVDGVLSLGITSSKLLCSSS